MITWNLWTGVPTVALWEAVALVLEIDPRSLKLHPDGWIDGPERAPVFERRSFPSQAKCDDFDTALSFAERAANAAGPIYLRTGLAVGMNKRTAQVSLTEVVAFFVSCDRPDIPAPLLTLAPGADKTPTEVEPTAANSENATVAIPPMASQAAEREAREDARLAHCEAEGLVFDKTALLRLPDGITEAAASLNPPITRQSLSTDVKAALQRRFERAKNGKG